MATKTAMNDLTITTHATQQDAILITSIFNGPMGLRSMDGMALLSSYDSPPTYAAFIKDHPVGSEGYRSVHALLNTSETIATFVKQGLLDRGLVYDLLWVNGAWDRCKAIALHERERADEPEIYANFERLALGQR